MTDGEGSGVQSFTALMDNAATVGNHGLQSGQAINLLTEMSLGQHTFTVNATDNAGNEDSSSVTFTIVVTPDSIKGDINQFFALGCIDNSGISDALKSKLAAAQADINTGKIQVAINTLRALLNDLNAQAGKHISTSCSDSNGVAFDAAAVLIADVKALLASLGANVGADPVMGSLVNSSNAGIPGATVGILNPSKKVVATATTDVTGFYYFPATAGLTSGSSYTAQVIVPKGYKTSTPPSQTFFWQAKTVILSDFVLKQG